MASAEKERYPVLKFLIILALVMMLVCACAFGVYPLVFKKGIQKSHDPHQIAFAFLRALMTNDLRFAKTLVGPEQKLLIDQWKAEPIINQLIVLGISMTYLKKLNRELVVFGILMTVPFQVVIPGVVAKPVIQ